MSPHHDVPEYKGPLFSPEHPGYPLTAVKLMEEWARKVEQLLSTLCTEIEAIQRRFPSTVSIEQQVQDAQNAPEG